jgi:hypothetical protein
MEQSGFLWKKGVVDMNIPRKTVPEESLRFAV